MACGVPRAVRADYDPLPELYDRYWAGRFDEPAMGVVERLLLDRIPAGARLLDLGCGTGLLARRLSARGLRVVGLDLSLPMLARAREQLPAGRFVRGDLRRFGLRPVFHAVICTFDTVNHLLAPEEVEDAFRNTRLALRPGGLFLFDVLTEEAYRSEWGKSSAVVARTESLILRGDYDAETRVARSRLLIARVWGGGRLEEVIVPQRSYRVDEIRGLLTRAGFRRAQAWRADGDLGMEGSIGRGRIFFLAE